MPRRMATRGSSRLDAIQLARDLEAERGKSRELALDLALAEKLNDERIAEIALLRAERDAAKVALLAMGDVVRATEAVRKASQ